MNKAKQGTQLQPLILDLLERYLNRQDLPVNVRVERLHGSALLVTHTTETCVVVRVEPVLTDAQARGL